MNNCPKYDLFWHVLDYSKTTKLTDNFRFILASYLNQSSQNLKISLSLSLSVLCHTVLICLLWSVGNTFHQVYPAFLARIVLVTWILVGFVTFPRCWCCDQPFYQIKTNNQTIATKEHINQYTWINMMSQCLV